MIVHFIPLVICILLTTIMLYNFVVTKDKIIGHLKVLAIIGVCAFNTTLFCYWYSEQYNYDIFWGHISYAMVSLFWGQGNGATYLLLVSRMKLIFGKSQYKSSPVVYYALFAMIAFVYVCQLSIAIALILIFEAHIGFDGGIEFVNWVNAIEIPVQFICSCSLIYIFCRKLLKVMAIASDEKHQEKFIQLATKITVLTGFSCTTTCLWLICAAIMDIDWVFGPPDNYNTKHVFHFNTGVALMLDCLVNVMVIFMSFKFSSKLFEVLCSPTSRMCQYCCSHLDLESHKKKDKMEEQITNGSNGRPAVEITVSERADSNNSIGQEGP